MDEDFILTTPNGQVELDIYIAGEGSGQRYVYISIAAAAKEFYKIFGQLPRKGMELKGTRNMRFEIERLRFEPADGRLAKIVIYTKAKMS